MNSPLHLHFTRDAFLDWVERQEGRFELKDGKVVTVTGGTVPHAKLIFAIALAIGRRIDRKKWDVTTADLAIEIEDDIRFPDIVIKPRIKGETGRIGRNPIILFEVLSPSSVGTDMVAKAAEYLSLPSLQTYVVASQDVPRMWVWTRSPETGRFPRIPDEIEGMAANLALPALGLSLPLAELYEAPDEE